jgi:hypothetical protein
MATTPLPVATRPKIIFFQGNTQDIQAFGIQDVDTGLFWNSAIITATLIDDEGNQIPECTAVTLVYQSGSNGNYTGTFGDINFQPPIGTGYSLIIDGDQGASHIHLEIPVEIRLRTQ